MRYINISSIFILAIVLLSAGCSGNSKITSPSDYPEWRGSLANSPIIFAEIEFTYNPMTRAGEAVVTNGRIAQIDDSEYYPTSVAEVEVEAEFVELDNEFNFIQGQVSLQQTGQLLNETEQADAVYFTVSVYNGDSDLTIFEPIGMVEYDNFPTWPVTDQAGMFQYPEHFFVNRDGFIGYQGNSEFPSDCFDDEEEPIFTPCYHPYIFFDPDDLSDQDTDHELAFEESDRRLFMIVLPESEYEPVTWSVFVLGYTSEPTANAPAEIITPFEDPDLPLVRNDTTGDYTFSVELRWLGSSDPSVENLQIGLDLSQLMYNPQEPYVFLEPTANELVWEGTVSLDLLTYLPPRDKVYLIPVVARQFNNGIVNYTNLDVPNQADFFVFPRGELNADPGHHVISYIDEDPITRQSDMYVQDSFSDERINISHDTLTELYHTISEDGNRVVWGYWDGGQAGVLFWDRNEGNQAVEFDMETIEDAFTQPFGANEGVVALAMPYISPDGTKVVMQVTWVDNSETAYGLAIANIPIDEMPDDLTVDDFRIIDDSNDIVDAPSQIIACGAPSISESIEYNFPINPPSYDPRNAYMMTFPVVANPEIGVSNIAVVLLGIDGSGNMYVDKDLTQFIQAGNGQFQPESNSSGILHPGYSMLLSRCNVRMVENDNSNVANMGFITYECEEQGNFRAYRTQINFNRVSFPYYLTPNIIFLLGYNPTWINPPKGGTITPVGLSYNESQEGNQFLAMSAIEWDDTPANRGSFTVVRDGVGRESEIWLDFEALDAPPSYVFNRGIFSLSNIAGLGNGNCDIAAVSQGLFSLNNDAPFPAVVLDSMATSPGDVYYIHWTGFWQGLYYKPTISLKRLTYTGTARYPRISGWISD